MSRRLPSPGRQGRGRGWGLLFASLLLLLRPAHAQVKPAELRYRWVYLAYNLQVTENVAKVEDLLRRAKAAGYNGAVVADYKLNILDRVPAQYFANLNRVKATADRLGITLYPSIAGFGYASGILAHDPNLAESIPVKEAPFVVRNGKAELEPAPDLLPNGGFEQANGDKFAGWDFQDAPGTGTFVERSVVHGGGAAFRMEEIGKANAPSGNGRITRTVEVSPWRQYHLSVWVRTQDFASAGGVRCTVLPVDGNGPSVCHNNWSVKRTQDWTECHAVFNSLGHSKLRVYMGVWGGTTGKLWFDDARLTEVGLLNVVRRETCPLAVKDAATGAVYAEGRDFAPVRDERMGAVPWPGEYEVYHPGPAITLLPGSRIKESARLRVSFFHTVSVYDNQVTCSLAASKVYEIVTDQIGRIQKAMAPKGYLLAYDEIRVAGWDGDAVKSGKTVGGQLADSVRRTTQIARAATPNADLIFWSDMFDPSHNAHGDYYLVNGSWASSWEGLPKDAIIVNWNSEKPKESLPFFGKRGHRQILAGYYDGSPDSIRQWLSAAQPSDNVVGAMYTTWQGNYSQLEAFAKAAWGGVAP